MEMPNKRAAELYLIRLLTENSGGFYDQVSTAPISSFALVK
jgi:hypothetical protein